MITAVEDDELVDAPMLQDSRSDGELIAAINRGEADAFEVLYRRYQDWVVNLACRFTGDRDLALDVLQDTFLYFLKKFPGFELTAQLKTFFYPAVRNLSIAARRKAERCQAKEGEWQAVESAVAAGPGPGAQEGLASALACLPDKQREVLLLRFVDGFSLEEVAEALAIPLGTVKSRLHHALETLRHNPATRKFFER